MYRPAAHGGCYNSNYMLYHLWFAAMIPDSRIEKLAVKIDDIIQSSANGVQVRISKTGKLCWLSAQHVDFMPGRVIIPAWLAKKLNDGIKADL